MGAERGELGIEFARSGVQGEEHQPPGSGGEFVSSHATQHVVFVAREAGPDDEYHTTRLCPAYPVPSERVSRVEAEDDGHTFCWTCFELEMRALADT